jgi:hypothetical protein
MESIGALAGGIAHDFNLYLPVDSASIGASSVGSSAEALAG